MTQHAVVNYSAEPYSVELRDIADPELADDHVVVQVKAVGVCGSDLHMWTGDQSWPVQYPIVLGHEFSGVIEGRWPKCPRLASRRSSRQRDACPDRIRIVRSRAWGSTIWIHRERVLERSSTGP